MITNRKPFSLIISSLFIFVGASKGQFDDCTATTECCDLFLESLKLNDFNVDRSCEGYWMKRHEISQKMSFNNFKCTGWVCLCPNIKQKAKDSLTKKFLKKVDEICYNSPSNNVAPLGWVFTIAHLCSLDVIAV